MQLARLRPGAAAQQASARPAPYWPFPIRPYYFMPPPAVSIDFELHYGLDRVERLREQLTAHLHAAVGRVHRFRE